MIKGLLVGAAIGYFGKKLYDDGKLDPYLERARSKLEEAGGTAGSAVPAAAKKGGKGQPDLAF